MAPPPPALRRTCDVENAPVHLKVDGDVIDIHFLDTNDRHFRPGLLRFRGAPSRCLVFRVARRVVERVLCALGGKRRPAYALRLEMGEESQHTKVLSSSTTQ